MEITHINVKYLKNLSLTKETLLNDFLGTWYNQSDRCTLIFRILSSIPSTDEEIYEIKTISTTNDEITLTPTSASHFIINLKKLNATTMTFQVMNTDCLGTSRPCVLEKAKSL